MKDDIKELRLYLGYTQKQFADIIGVSTSAVKQWERGACLPSPARAKVIKEIKASALQENGVTDAETKASALQEKYIRLKTKIL